MSNPGPSRPAISASAYLLLLAALGACGLAAQGLPDIQQIEVEVVRIAILDEGKRRGTLEGKSARRTRDGKITLQDAVLTLIGADGDYVARAGRLLYAARSEDFECPDGLTADLPDGGMFTVPAATGTIQLGKEPRILVRGTGEMKLRQGSEASPELQARAMDAELLVNLAASDRSPSLVAVRMTGRRGVEMRVAVAEVPAPDGVESGPGVLALACFGDFVLNHDAVKARADISLRRQARMELAPAVSAPKPAQTSLLIASEEIDLRGPVPASMGDSLNFAMLPLEIDAEGGVSLSGPAFKGFGRRLEYRADEQTRKATLFDGAELELDQTAESKPDQPPPPRKVLRLKAARSVALTTPVTQPASEPPGRKPPAFAVPAWVEMLLDNGARVWRTSDDKVEWQLAGQQIGLRSAVLPRPPQLPATEPDPRLLTFSVQNEGFSPLLRVAGMTRTSDEEIDASAQRAAVYGASASGTMQDGMLKARVLGPEIVALLYADFALGAELRYGLGLRRRPKDSKAQPGRLEVRAAQWLDVEVETAPEAPDAKPRPILVSAYGSVEMDHTPLPRNDTNLVSLRGESAQLVLQGVRVGHTGPRAEARLELAVLRAAPGGRCVATVGYDLLISGGFEFASGTDSTELSGHVLGPGRMILRDQDSLKYFRRVVARLPRRGDADLAVPDAGWMNFGGRIDISADAAVRSMECADVEFRLVSGEFEKPRAGQSGVNDLPELEEADVRPMFLARGRRLLIQSSGFDKKPPAVVNLMRLEGGAVLRSEMDRLQATADDSIEATGADDQQSAGNPLAVVMLGNPVLVLDQAGLLFGDVVTRGVFAYDGRWRLAARDRLELTVRPLAIGEPDVIARLRTDLDAVGDPHRPGVELAMAAYRAAVALAALVETLPPEHSPETDQPRHALEYAQAAVRESVAVMRYEATGGHAGYYRTRAARASRRAHALLSGLTDIAAMGDVDGQFHDMAQASPPLRMSMDRVVVSLNGIGEIVDTSAQGPVVVSRSDYTIKGTRISQARDGTLLLDGAEIQLPEGTGVHIDGVTAISLRQVRGMGPGGLPRTTVTEVRGRKLGVRIELTSRTPEGRQNDGR